MSVICLVDRTESKLRAVILEIEVSGGTELMLVGDVSKNEDIDHVIRETVAGFARLDVLVNNAAALVAGTAESITEDGWDLTFATGVKGVWLLSRAALPHIRAAGRGSIINISSVLGLVGTKNRVAYVAAKGAVTLMTKAMALDHAHEQIRVNAICPGIVDTEMVGQFIRQAPDPETARRQRIGLHPLGRFGTPEDVANLAVHLASDELSWVTGVAWPVDGGYTAV
jgi:2,3-dihydro-2,3-dihydroxybenzoate dehydrogenase